MWNQVFTIVICDTIPLCSIPAILRSPLTFLWLERCVLYVAETEHITKAKHTKSFIRECATNHKNIVITNLTYLSYNWLCFYSKRKQP